MQLAVRGLESSIDLAPQQRARVLWRMDGGFGSDDNLRWLLARGYQVLCKGFAGSRAGVLARAVTRWDASGDVWLGWVDAPVAWSERPVQVLVQRRTHAAAFRHTFYVTTLHYPSKRAMIEAYHGRGAAEIEQFRGDKQALALAQRRKGRLKAQKALLTLVDLAHNLLAHLRRNAPVHLAGAVCGPRRTQRDLLAIPGHVARCGPEVTVTLDASHPLASLMHAALERYRALELPPAMGLP